MATKPNKTIYQDAEYEVVENDEISTDVLSAADQKKIISQIDKEYNLAYPYNEAKRKTQLARLKLYNNQRRDTSAVGDPLMFTVFNTILASLYDDRLIATWEGRGGEGDDDVEENLNALTNFDYDVMQKAKLDYNWDWDTCFFGRGLCLQMGFDRRQGVMAPIAEILDPTTFIRDPQASSVNGDMQSKGAMRFGGWEVGASYYELKDSPGYFNLHLLKKDKEIKSLTAETRQARREAQGNTDFKYNEETLGKYDNYEFQLLNWVTHIRGVKYLVTLANGRNVIVRYLKLKDQDRWPITDRTLYPISHDWDGVSVPDLTEDKQRARAILLNIGLVSAKADVMPTYLFDQTRIKNKNDLNFRINKFVGVDGRIDNALAPIQKSTAHQYVNLIMDVLDQSAQRATATPEIQQGVNPKQERTLGELNLVSSKVDTRYSMSAKIFGWSEADFWKQWYRQYKFHFKDKIDEKIIRIQGAMAPIWRPLKKDNIVAQVDPDVKIESKVISEGKRIREQQSFDAFAGVVLSDPENNRRYIQRRMGKLRGLTKEELDLIFPPTVDELQAEDENILLNNEKLPTVRVTDDHKTHLQIHAKANQNAYSLVHMKSHRKLMLIRRDRPELFPQPQQPGQPGQPNQQGQMPMQTPPGARPAQMK